MIVGVFVEYGVLGVNFRSCEVNSRFECVLVIFVRIYIGGLQVFEEQC